MRPSTKRQDGTNQHVGTERQQAGARQLGGVQKHDWSKTNGLRQQSAARMSWLRVQAEQLSLPPPKQAPESALVTVAPESALVTEALEQPLVPEAPEPALVVTEALVTNTPDPSVLPDAPDDAHGT